MKRSFLIVIFVVCCPLYLFGQRLSDDTLFMHLGNVPRFSGTILQILSNPRMLIKDTSMKILDYNYSIHKKNGDWIGPKEVKGSFLPEDLQKMILKMREGEQLLLEDIHIFAEKKRRSAGSLTITIVENNKNVR